MAYSGTTLPSCLSIFSTLSRYKSLATPTSTNFSTNIIPKLAAASLITASAGLGAYYAWTSGAHHGPVLALLLVLMAIGLELAKPFSIAAAFEAFRSWRLVQGAALVVLGLVAVTYSLTAELSLMASARGDLVAERASQSDSGAKANDRYDRAKLELLTLPTTRPMAELEAKIAGLLQTPGADGCREINGRVTREICPQVTELKAEAARAERREKLEAALSEVEQKSGEGTVIKAADPGATALAAYLGLIGLDVKPTLLTELLILVGVLALEIGSALSLVMVRAVSQVVENRDASNVKTDAVQQPLPEAMVPVVHPVVTGVSEEPETAREDVKKRILKQVKASGGSVSGSQRGLSKLIGADKTTMRRAINGLVAAGVLAMEANRSGTLLKMVA